MRANVLLVNRTVTNVSIINYHTEVTVTSWINTFSYNLGVDSNLYGYPLLDGYCMMGFKTLDLYFYRNSTRNLSSSFEFVYNGTNTSQMIAAVSIYPYKNVLTAACFGYTGNCSVGYFFNQTVNNCTPCSSNCLLCLNSTYCMDCQFNYTFVSTAYTQECQLNTGLTSFVAIEVEKSNNVPLIVGLVIAFVVLAFIVFFFLWWKCRSRGMMREEEPAATIDQSNKFLVTAEAQDFD